MHNILYHKSWRATDGCYYLHYGLAEQTDSTYKTLAFLHLAYMEIPL